MDAKMQIRLPKEQYDQFKEIAQSKSQVPSLIVRKWIQDYINKNSKGMDKMKLEELKEMVADSVVLSEQNGTYFADVVEENGDEDRLAQSTSLGDLHQQLKDFGQIKGGN